MSMLDDRSGQGHETLEQFRRKREPVLRPETLEAVDRVMPVTRSTA